MLMDTLRADLSRRIDHQVAMLVQASPTIRAAEMIEATLAQHGLTVSAVGHLHTEGCEIGVVCSNNPQQVQDVLILAELEFRQTDAVGVAPYDLRAFEISIGGQIVRLAVHHAKNDEACITAEPQGVA